ncbi:MAG: EAL domain-containing protein [Gammaproteobacteria bacterium]|nr:EAL domain-containing protein [Gammaproteobacteria bacterium]
MLTIRSSIQTSLGLTVLVMGLVGIFLTVITGEIYRHQALENQRKAFEELVKLKVDDILQDILKKTSELGLSIQSERHFRTAFQGKSALHIQAQLDQQFSRLHTTINALKLEKLVAFDKNFNIVGHSSEGSNFFGATTIPCPGIMDIAVARTGPERIKVISELCMAQGKPIISVLVAIGGASLKGYLLVVVDPTINISTAEKHLAMPLKIMSTDNTVIFKSREWPNKESGKKFIVAEYTLYDPRNTPILELAFASDVASLYEKLEKTRILIIIAAALATCLTGLLSLLLLQKSALKPLSILTKQLQLVRQDKTHLGEPVSVSGNIEICKLADNFNDMSGELHILYNTLENMAFTDSLTGLPNRALFYDRLEQAAQLGQQQNAPFLLLMLDLDRFKYINDTLGHHIGDQLLQEVGMRLQNSVRTSDTIARLGGDEFAAILPTNDGERAGATIAEKILKTLNAPIIIDKRTLTISASIGIVRCPIDGDDINQLLQRADVAMYHAKNNHHGYSFYDNELDKHSILQFNLEENLYDAIENNNLELYYQPKIDLTLGQTVAVEALLRWNHPTRGLITPDEFIPLAEHSGLIHPLTQWVINTALKQCAEWHNTGLKIGMAINLSARSLEDTQILDTVRTALRTTKVNPQFLSWELTESAVMADPHRAMEVMSSLRALGTRISVDDFGTGYSSLAYLKKLPVSELKIDKSFVIDMNQDSSDEVIVHSTVDLAHNMGLVVTAEGVEDQQTWDKLSALGCDLAQGYYMCKPCSAANLSKWFFTSQWGLRANINKTKAG